MKVKSVQLKTTNNYLYKDSYICSTDIEQKRSHNFTGDDGQKYSFYIPKGVIKNHRLAHPNYGRIVYSPEDAQFPVGTDIIVRHFTFENTSFEKQVLFEEDGEEYYKVTNFDLLFGIINDELIPREGVLLCEHVEGKLVNTSLQVTADLEGNRRDIAKVIKTWEGCTEYTVGDYVLLAKGGDYEFTFNEKPYLKVDHYLNDVIAVVDSPEWRVDEIRKHANDHNEVTYI